MTMIRGGELLRRLQLEIPVIQAPMAGVSTPSMAAAAAAPPCLTARC